MDFEFKEPIITGFFYKGIWFNILIYGTIFNLIILIALDDEKSFEKAIFCGNERKLFMFDMLVFVFIDYFAFNYLLAAVVTYIIRIVGHFFLLKIFY